MVLAEILSLSPDSHSLKLPTGAKADFMRPRHCLSERTHDGMADN